MDPRNHPEQVSLSPVNHTVDGRIGGSTRLPDDALHTNGEQTTVAFVKGGKRKRLSKVGLIVFEPLRSVDSIVHI